MVLYCCLLRGLNSRPLVDFSFILIRFFYIRDQRSTTELRRLEKMGSFILSNSIDQSDDKVQRSK